MSDYITKTGYITYECNTCGRTVDVLQDNVRVFTNSCTITEHCQGKLHPIQTKNIRSILAASENTNLSNWSSQQRAPVAQTVETPIVLNSKNDIITIAVEEPANVATLPQLFYLRFNLNTTVNSFQEYTYLLSNFSEIIGADSTSLGKVLRFTHADSVLVYIEGVLLTEGTDYSLLFDSVNDLGYSISLVNEVFVKSNVRVVVFTPLPAQYTNSIKFTIHNVFSTNTAWSNVRRVKIGTIWYWLYSSDEINLLPLNTRLNLLLDSNSFSFTSLEKIKLLFANPNYTPVDRQLSKVITLSSASSPDKYFKAVLHNDIYEFQGTPNLLDSISPILIDRSVLKDPALETASDITGVSDTTLINKDTETNIIGVI